LKAEKPMAVEYQLHGDRNTDMFRFMATLEDPKVSSVWWCLCYKNTDSRIYFILFPKPKQERAKCLLWGKLFINPM